ncbi:MAG: DUF2997 domain-containing protein [Lentisphaeria bacterium]|jgi:hypothetical protein|nr:DUF2997 domain-containing protein [Lentisphaeria bacterium]
MKTIRIDIGPDGTVAIDAAGFSGPDCEQATKFLEEALGEVRERKLKPEHRRRATIQRRQGLGNGETQP